MWRFLLMRSKPPKARGGLSGDRWGYFWGYEIEH